MNTIYHQHLFAFTPGPHIWCLIKTVNPSIYRNISTYNLHRPPVEDFSGWTFVSVSNYDKIMAV